MTQRLTKLAAVLMVMPLTFLVMNLANEVIGSERFSLDPVFGSRVSEWVVVLSPFVAVALVLLPGVRITFDRQPAAPAMTVALRLGRFQVLVLAAAAITAIAFLGYGFVENFVPRNG